MLFFVMVMGLLGAVFTLREWWWLYVAGIWVYMTLIPAVEASEQTVIQKVVPFTRQGRVFGFAAAFESAAAPITAFLTRSCRRISAQYLAEEDAQPSRDTAADPLTPCSADLGSSRSGFDSGGCPRSNCQYTVYVQTWTC